MRLEVDLGFAGAALAALVFVAPAIALLIGLRWRAAAARSAEVRRLMLMAAEETSRIETESLLAFPAPERVGERTAMPVAPPQCAVCYSPTTRRCSRCKAVKYCSGKCQIIHWRLGHKEECLPPRVDDYYNGMISVSNLKGVRTEQSVLSNGLEIEKKPHAEQVEKFSAGLSSESNFSSEVFSEDNGHEVKPIMDTSIADHILDSSVDSSSSRCSSLPRPMETSNDASTAEDQHLCHVANVEEAFPHDVSPDRLRDASEMNLTKIRPSNLASSGFSINNLSYTPNVKQKASGRKSEEVLISDNCMAVEPSEGIGECDRSNSCEVSSAGNVDSPYSESSEERLRMQLDPCFPMQSSKLSGQFMPSPPTSADENSSGKEAPMNIIDQFNTDPTDSAFDESGSVCSERGNEVFLLKHQGLTSPSSVSSSSSLSSSWSRASSIGGGYSISRASSSMYVAPKVRVIFSDDTSSVSNGFRDLKPSLRGVVPQLKPSKALKHFPSAPSSGISGKHKGLFPYDLFIKLYNCDKVEFPPCGLTNCGNSCYANAVLQCLTFTRPLTAYLLQGHHNKSCLKVEDCFSCELESLLMKAKEGESPLSPIRLLSHFNKTGSPLAYGREEDAHEFLRYTIDALQSVCLKEARANEAVPLAEETTLIQLIFGGYLLSKIKCMTCRGKSEKRERMMDLTVEIHGDIATLEEALAQFTATEILDGENKYQCSRCNSFERAKKKLNVLEAPNVLTIALKRFEAGKYGKLNKAVRFPEYLNLAPYMSDTDDKSPVYRLYGVVVHLDIMNSAGSGHYVSYVKSTQKKWYKVNDNMVKPVELEKALSKNAYMLFYARCSPRAPSTIRNGLARDHVKWRRGDHRQHSCFRPSDLLDERSRSRMKEADSSSDVLSDISSWSDEGSRSTESTSTNELSDYLFGSGEEECFQGKGRRNPDSDAKLTGQYSSSGSSSSRREANFANSYEVRSGGVMRRPTTMDPTAQTFY